MRLDDDRVSALMRDYAIDLELVDPGMLQPHSSGQGAWLKDGAFGWPPMGQGIGLGRHPLDVYLSVGRHAAERAKMSGYRTLHCGGFSPTSARGEPGFAGGQASSRLSGAGARARRAYEWLCRYGDFELAAAIGACIACAQMGLEVVLYGARTAEVCDLVAQLHPDAIGWLVDAQAGGALNQWPSVGGAPWLCRSSMPSSASERDY